MYRINFVSCARIYVCISHNFSVLMLSRVIGGMSAGMVMPGVTGLIANFTKPSKSKKLWLHVSDYQFWIHFRTRDWWIYGRSFTSYAILLCRSIRYSSIYNVNCIDSRSKKSTTSGFQKLEPQLLTKINWKVFITPVILTLVLSFGLSAFETLYSLYTA